MKNGKLTTMDLLKSNAIGILALMMILSGVTGATGTYHFTGDVLDKETFQKMYEYVYEHGDSEATCLKTWHAARTSEQLCQTLGIRSHYNWFYHDCNIGTCSSHEECAHPVPVDARCR